MEFIFNGEVDEYKKWGKLRWIPPEKFLDKIPLKGLAKIIDLEKVNKIKKKIEAGVELDHCWIAGDRELPLAIARGFLRVLER